MKYFGHEMPNGWEDTVASEFKKADKDGSEKVSPKEMFVYIFEMVDADDDGEIQLDELYAAIEKIAEFSKNTLIDGWKKKVYEAVKGVDKDESGGASKKEVYAALKAGDIPDINDLFVKKDKRVSLRSLLGLEKRVPSPEEIWEQFDTNRDGEWDLKEAQGAFKGAMKYFGHKLPEGWKKRVAEEFKKADTDKSGKVAPKEMGMYLFKLIDTDEDGEISLDELYAAIEEIAEFSNNTLIDGWQ